MTFPHPTKYVEETIISTCKPLSSRHLTRLLPLLLGLLAFAWPAPAPRAAPFGGGTVLNYAEELDQKVRCRRAGGGLACSEVTTGKFKLTAHLPMTGIDFDNLNQTTPFSIRLDDFKFNEALGADPSYIDGKNRVRIAVRDIGPRDRGYTRILYVSLLWNRSHLAVVMQGKIPEYVDGLLALPYVGRQTSPIESTAWVQIRFDEATWEFDLPVSGRVVSSPFLYGNEQFIRSKVRLTGAGVLREGT